MTSALLLVRDCIIYSVNVWLAHMIELELVRRGSSFTRARIAHSACHFETEATHAIHIRPNSRRAVLDRAEGLQRGSRAL